MSIITEALKKAENDSKKQQGSLTAEMSSKPSKKNPESDKPIHKKNIGRPRSVHIMFFSILFVIITLFFLVEDLHFSNNVSLKNVISPTQRTTGLEVQEKPIPEVKPVYTLRGIMFSSNSPVAVIDDLVVREGEQLDGYLVKKINADSVSLEKDGTTVTLKLKR